MRTLLLISSLISMACGSRPPPDPRDEPTLRPQEQPLAQSGCQVGATQYPLGVQFTAADGCNTCTCEALGPVCTKMGCDAVDLAELPRFALRFARGSAVPEGDGMSVLAAVAKTLRQNPQDQVVVLGHVTSVEALADAGLGLRRAESAAARLRSLGVAADQLVAEDAGTHEAPVALFRRVRR
jgi:outer membrane protein OmpA-like peptidoglycan-associated protein